MSDISIKTLFYYDGPMIVAFIGPSEIVVGTVSARDGDFFYGPVLTGEELLGYLRGELDIHLLYSEDREYRKVLWVGSAYVGPVSQQEVSENGCIPGPGSYFMLPHRESVKALVEEVGRLIMSK